MQDILRLFNSSKYQVTTSPANNPASYMGLTRRDPKQARVQTGSEQNPHSAHYPSQVIAFQMAVTMLLDTDPFLLSVVQLVQQYMSQNDASHNFEHIQRVVGLSKHIYTHCADSFRSQLDLGVITLSALLHDVGDRKYLKEGEDPYTMVYNLLQNLGASKDLSHKVQTICLGVSYSSEIKDPERVQELILLYPELAVVQDADRLDSIGAIGVGRCFTFGGARTDSVSMEEAMEQVETRLLSVSDMMKTDVGRRLAKERSRRLMMFRDWYREEESLVGMMGGCMY